MATPTGWVWTETGVSCLPDGEAYEGVESGSLFTVEQHVQIQEDVTGECDYEVLESMGFICRAPSADGAPGADAASAAEVAPAAGGTAAAEVWEGGPARESYAEYMDGYWFRLTNGQLWYEGAPGRPELPPGTPLDEDFEKLRAAAEANRERQVRQGVKPLSPFQKMTMGDLERLCGTVYDGEMYGLPVPVNLDDLRKRGEKWLTEAFRRAGTIAKDNSVQRIVDFKRLPMTGKDAAGGSGPKAFIKVQWEKQEEGLHEDLFCKMPWDMGGKASKSMLDVKTPEDQAKFYKNKEKGIDPYYRWKISATSDYEAQEVTIYRFLGPIFPFRIPKYYFADICRQNTNYVMITEKIAYPKKGTQTEVKPWDILPVAEKYFDFQLEPRMRYEMYYCIMRAQARMAAWDKLGFFNSAPPEMRGLGMSPPAVGTFEWPPKLPAKRRAAKVRNGAQNANLWTEFLTDQGKNLYDEKYREPAFLDALCSSAQDFLGYKDDVFLYGCLFPEMTAFQHSNLQSDNAYYWYNDRDQMDAGLIDWGGAGPGNFTSRLQGSITSAEGYILDEHEEGLLRCFIGEYYKECGIKLDYGEVYRQWMLAYCGYICSCGTNIEMEIFRETPRESWKDVKSKWDDKAVGRWNVRCYVFMIGSMLEYLHLRWTKKGQGRLHCHETFLEWKAYWEGKGMT